VGSCPNSNPFDSYVASLEARIEKLEKKLSHASSQNATDSMQGTENLEPSGRKASNATLRPSVQDIAAKRRETTDVNELVSDFGFLSGLRYSLAELS
jgi:predicted  nucleic acid-binding Zn-ribbon protein